MTTERAYQYEEFSASLNSYVCLRGEEGVAEDERKAMLAALILKGTSAEGVVEFMEPHDFAAQVSLAVGVVVREQMPDKEVIPIDGDKKAFAVKKDAVALVALMRDIVKADDSFAMLVHRYLREALRDAELAPFMYDNRDKKKIKK